MELREVMTTDVRCAEPTATMEAAARMMAELNVGSIPICNGDSLLGIITDRDITIRCVAQGQDPRQCRVADHMSKDVVVGDPSMSVEEALRLMSTGQIRRLPIIEGENGRLVGMVSLGDLSVETDGDAGVAASLEDISQPVHQTDGGEPKASAA
ncbi:MAG: CBS domain-containing protein [Dehalococcoidia bacterium]